MCGRFTLHHTPDEIADRFDIEQTLFALPERYNIAPQQTVAVVRSGAVEDTDTASAEQRVLDGFRWGLVPFWSKDPTIGSKMINARAETVAEKPSFKNALVRRRCLIPTDGFYEWEKSGDGGKQPIHFRRRDGGLFAFAGLWEEWKNPEEDADAPPLRTCTILTTRANDTVGRIHDRMPVILQTPEDEAFWLDPTVRRADDLLPLFASYPDDLMEAFAVSRRVNSPAYDAPDILTPTELHPT